MQTTDVIQSLAKKPGQVWKTTRQLERDYNLAAGQVSRWKKEGKIPPEFVDPNPGPRGAISIDEYIVWRLVNTDFQRKNQPLHTPRIVFEADPATGAPSKIIPSQVILPRNPIMSTPKLDLPDGYIETRLLVDHYIKLRNKEVENGNLKPKSVKLDTFYLHRFAKDVPVFPWGQTEIDNYLMNLNSSWHAKRYAKTFTRWVLARHPGARDILPTPAKPGKQRPPRHDVLTPDQERAALNAIRDHDYTLWVYVTVMSRTGCRPFELLERNWEEVSAQGFYSPGRAMKKSGHVMFPPGAGLYELLLTLPEPHTGPLFPATSGKRKGQHINSEAMWRRLNRAWSNAGFETNGPKGSYIFRHLFVERMRDKIGYERLAPIMRTSVKMLEEVYGKPTDESYRTILAAAYAEVWGNSTLSDEDVGAQQP